MNRYTKIWAASVGFGVAVGIQTALAAPHILALPLHIALSLI